MMGFRPIGAAPFLVETEPPPPPPPPPPGGSGSAAGIGSEGRGDLTMLRRRLEAQRREAERLARLAREQQAPPPAPIRPGRFPARLAPEHRAALFAANESVPIRTSSSSRLANLSGIGEDSKIEFRENRRREWQRQRLENLRAVMEKLDALDNYEQEAVE